MENLCLYDCDLLISIEQNTLLRFTIRVYSIYTYLFCDISNSFFLQSFKECSFSIFLVPISNSKQRLRSTLCFCDFAIPTWYYKFLFVIALCYLIVIGIFQINMELNGNSRINHDHDHETRILGNGVTAHDNLETQMHGQQMANSHEASKNSILAKRRNISKGNLFIDRTESKVLVIYTGGTIGMMRNERNSK